MKIKHLALALAVGLGMGALPALADDDKTRDDDRNVFERGRDKVMGKNDGERSEKLDAGVLKLSIEDIQQIKEVLTSRGYAFQNATGKVDDEFDKAIERFQTDVGIKKTGDLDVATLNALGFSAIVAIHPDVKGSEGVRTEGTTAGETKAGERPAGTPQEAGALGGGKNVLGYLVIGQDEIENIQERLKEEGYFRGEENGAWSPELADALKRFQQAKGVKSPTGVLDLATLAWFPNAGIDVEVTNEPEVEISEPGKAGVEKGSLEKIPQDR